jgi:hypothetical protein
MSELQFHPLADIFPLMKGAEFDELVADIKANGLREKIDLYQGKIVDGRNRYLALQRLGIDPSAEPGKYFRKAIYAHTIGGEIAPHERNNDDSVRAYVISKNIHRRHLTAEQKRDLLVKLVAAQPEKADRVLAREAKVDHKQVSRARRKAEATGAIAPVEKRTGADRKARKQPIARKAKGWGRIVLADEGRYATAQESAALRAQWAAEGRTPDNPEGSSPQNIAEAEESYQYDRACLFLEGMTGETRQKFFVHLWDKYRDELIAAQVVSYERQIPPKPDGFYSKENAAPQCDGDNAPPPEVGAEIMKAKMAALDDGLDIPESLRRTTA